MQIVHRYQNPSKTIFRAPPPRKRAPLASPQGDSFQATETEEARVIEPGMSLRTRVGMMTVAGLSLVGSFTGTAQASQMTGQPLLMQPLRQEAQASDLIHPSVTDRYHRETMLETLAELPPDVLDLLVETGLTFKVGSRSDRLVDTGAIELLNTTEFRNSAESDAEAVARIMETPMGLRRKEHRVQETTGGRWRFFRAPDDLSEDEITLEEMARAHGFKDSEEIEWFMNQVERANPKTLQMARQNPINKASYESTLKGRKARKARERLEEYQNDPQSIPLRLQNFTFAVPDWHQTRLGSETVDVSLHDRETIQRWTQFSSKISAEETLLGQYFGENGKHLVLMTYRGMRTPETLIHEAGHAVERLALRNSPHQYFDFMSRLGRAHNEIKPRGAGVDKDPDRGSYHRDDGRKQISAYSRTNPKEYFAEGFAHYVKDPEKLKEQDGRLYDLVEEGIRLARGVEADLEAR